MKKFKILALLASSALVLGVGSVIGINCAVKPIEAKAEVDTGKYTFDFEKNFQTYASKWNTTYNERVVESSEIDGDLPDVTFTFSGANKSSSNITSMPVTKNADLSIELNETGYVISKVAVTFYGWTQTDKPEKEQKLTISPSDSSNIDVKTFTDRLWESGDISLNNAVATSATVSTTLTNNQIGWKKIELTIAENTKTLSSIEVSGNMGKTTYEEGEEFDPTGLVATGTYSDLTTADLTSSVDWSVDPAVAALGTTSVDVTASYNDVESDPYTVSDIVVNPFSPIGGIVDGEAYLLTSDSSSDSYILKSGYIKTEDSDKLTEKINFINDYTDDAGWVFDRVERNTYTISKTVEDKTYVLGCTTSNDGVNALENGTQNWIVEDAGDGFIYLRNSVNNTRYLSLYSTAPDFRTYTNTNNAKMKLYSADPVEEIAVESLPSKVEYSLNETLDPTGIVVSAVTEASEELENVAASCTYSPMTLSTAGTQTITVTHRCGATATFDVTVSATIVLVESVSLNIEAGQSFKVGTSFQLEPTILPSNATDKSVTYSVDEDDLVSIDAEGLMQFLAVGTATVTCTANGGDDIYDSIQIQITPIPYSQQFTKVKSLAELNVGDNILIVGEKDAATYALGSQESNNRKAIEIVKNTDGTVQYDTDLDIHPFELRIGTTQGSYAFYDRSRDGYIYAASSSSNYLRTKDVLDGNGSFSIAFANEEVDAAALGDYTHNLLFFNKSSLLFSCYNKIGTNNKVSLYKAQASYPSEEVFQWSQDFLSSITCDATGQTDPVHSTSWVDMAEAFADLGNEDKALLINAEYEAFGSGASTVVTARGSTYQIVAEAIRLYDYIVNKYGTDRYPAFIGERVIPVSSFSFQIAPMLEKQNITELIVVISVIAIPAVGAFLFIKKRKEN